MNITVTDQNNITADGVELVAVSAGIRGGCKGCHFKGKPCKFPELDCLPCLRGDGRNIIWEIKPV